MSKHTPGPWAIAKDGELITAGTNGLHVAHVVTIGMGKSVKANAHLIAAAPELLEALENPSELTEEKRLALIAKATKG